MAKKQIFRLIIAIFLPLSIISLYATLNKSQPKDSSDTKKQTYEQITAQNNDPTNHDDGSIKKNIVQKTTAEPPIDNTEKLIIPSSEPAETTTTPKGNETENLPVHIKMEIGSNTYALAVPDNTTAYEAMKKLSSENDVAINFKQFSGLGYFVDEINGQKTDSASGKYWIYYINNQPSQVGISKYILKNNDLITWKYGVPKI